jgi:hypothetical protein
MRMPIRRSMNGLGTSPCPSDEQLAGIVDPTDPCQAAAISGAPVPGTGVTPFPASTGTMPPGYTPPTGCPAGSTCTYIAGVPDMAIYAIGGILIAFMLIGGGRR